MNRPTSSLTATKLRVILVIAMLLITALSVGLFYVGYRQLSSMATTVSRSIADANASKNTLSALQETERELDANRDVIARAGKVVADSKQYNYQNTVINDLQTYAGRAGLTINTIDFSGGSAAATPAATPGATATPAASGPQSSKVTVTLDNPVNYDNLLHFLRSVELNLTKLQIASVSLTKSSENPKAVTTTSLTIELYTK